MGRHSSNRSTILAAVATCAAAGALLLSPPRLQLAVRGAVVDVIAPGSLWVIRRYEGGRESVLAGYSRWIGDAVPSTAIAGPVPETGARLTALEQACRRLRVENARLRDELESAEKYGVSPLPSARRAAPQLPTVVRAAVIRQQNESVAAQQLLDTGRSQGLVESDLVVDDARPGLDEGSDAGVEPEQDVLIGRCVVGRIASVGRWTSVLQPITDPRYRGLAQIIRPSDQGGSFGAEGILVGQGTELLKLIEVPTTQSVRVGDEVYTSDRDRRFPIPLYYGRVVRIEEAGRSWDISVRPAVRVNDLKKVDVLKFDRVGGKMLAE